MAPLDDPAMPRPKSAQLARGARRYRRFVASPKQWQAIQSAKLGPCRVCGAVESNGRLYSRMHLHHLVSREDHGDDYADNIVPLCQVDHDRVTHRLPRACERLLASLSDAEYAYMVARGGEDYAERAYGLRYQR